MEGMLTLNRTALVVQPKQPFLDWLHGVDPKSHHLTLDELRDDATVYLLPESDSEAAWTEQLRAQYRDIFNEQLDGWFRDQTTWPTPATFKVFTDWFYIESHSMVIDMAKKPLLREEI